MKDAPALQGWYKHHLGIDVQEWGGTAFPWTDSEGKPAGGMTTWRIAPADEDDFAPSQAGFMVNYRVDDLHGLIAALKAEGCDVLAQVDESEYGTFAWVLDPEGNKVDFCNLSSTPRRAGLVVVRIGFRPACPRGYRKQ